MNTSSTPRQPVPQSSGTSLEDALARITRHPEIAALLKEPGARIICPASPPGTPSGTSSSTEGLSPGSR